MTEGHRRYVDQVTRQSAEYTQQLLSENDRLRSIIATLEVEKAQAEAALRAAHSEMKGREASEAALRRRLEEIEQESSAFANRYLEIEQQNANLANLYVASYQLHVTFDREAVLAAIKEIVINLIGSEELAIFEKAGDELLLIDSFGVENSSLRRVEIGSGLIGGVARSGERYVLSGRPNDGLSDLPVTAVIPLEVDGHLVGLLAIFRLLPQKESLQPIDFELFDLLASHGATALFCTAAYEKIKTVGDPS